MHLPSALRAGRRPVRRSPVRPGQSSQPPNTPPKSAAAPLAGGRTRTDRPVLPRAPLPRHPVRRVTAAWRRSLRLRVVATTVALSLLVVGLIGAFLYAQVREGILDARLEGAVAEALSGAQLTGVQSETADPTAEDVNVEVEERIEQLAAAGGETGRREVLLLAPSRLSSTEVYQDAYSGVNGPGVVPGDLRSAVQMGSTGFSWVTVVSPEDGADVPALVVGAPITVLEQDYELYYVFPLTSELRTLDLVRNTFAVAGLALVVLVGLIAYVVARTVVTPVRLAARIAERLAAGKLEERMHIRGEDDLARLAASFNRMATNLQRQIRALEDLSRVQRRFVSDVSHELRTPLTTVRMAADVLHGFTEDFPADVGRASELLQTQLDRFEALLADLLEISRFDAGAAQLDLEQVDVPALVRRVVEATEPLAERRGSTISMSAPAESCVVECDARRIERIVRNLVVNAIEHGEGKPIAITVASNDRAVAIGVRDRGVGLSSEEAARVFDRFWRADPSRARHTGGTGLGLSISLEDAHLHGGWLQAYGESGHGAHFRLTLPRTAGAQLQGSPLELGPARPDPIVAIGMAYQQTEGGHG